jgi:hypothetical protein
MAGTVDIVLRCLAGLRPRGEVRRFDPALREDHLLVRSRPGPAQPIKVLVRDQTIELGPGTEHEFSLEQRP